MKKKYVLRPYVLPCLYILLVIFLMTLSTNIIYKDDPLVEELSYVNDEVFDNTIPVINEVDEFVINPYEGNDISIKVGYYNYDSKEEEQVGSIVKYDNTYLQNTGITYTSENTFNVLSIMDGEITKIYNNDILGNVIEVTHENDFISVYQVVDNIKVKEHDIVKKGDVIAESGNSKLYSDGKNLHFEVIKDGITIDPNIILGKNTKDI